MNSPDGSDTRRDPSSSRSTAFADTPVIALRAKLHERFAHRLAGALFIIREKALATQQEGSLLRAELEPGSCHLACHDSATQYH